MPNVFAAADALSSAAISRLMGEQVRLLPMIAGGDYTVSNLTDPNRQPVDFAAVLSGALGRMNASGDRADNFPSHSTTRDRQISVDNVDMPVGIKAGDRIKAIEQVGLPEFEITSDPIWDGSGRWILPLVSK